MVTTVTDNSPQSINTSLFSLDRDVQEIKKVTDKLKGISLESDVISVNGKRGIVELNASDVGALPDTTFIPSKTSDLENDSGFVTMEEVAESYVPLTRTINDKPLDEDITLTASDVGALPDTTVIPKKTSELTNDSGFITSSDSITGNAATATKAEQDANGNVITDTYATKEELDNKVDKVSGKGLSTNDYTTAEKEKLAGLSNYDDSAVKTLIANEAKAREDADKALQTAIDGKAAASHTHDDRYYTETEINEKLYDINEKIGTLQENKNDLLDMCSDLYDKVADETSSRTEADTALQNQITANKSAIDTLNGTGEGSVQKTVTDEIAKVVANAPEDFDTLKEISDWIDTHEDSASAMNTAISTNATNLSNHITNKSNPHSVTKAQVGLGNVVNTGDSATPVSGGTTKFTTGGAYTELAKKNDKITVSEDYNAVLTDASTFTAVPAGANPTTGTNRKLSQVWTYIKGKADSVYAKLSHTHTKSQITDFPTSLPAKGGTADKVKNALTVNGKTYDGSSAVDAGTQTIANGGTGATTAKGAEYNLVIPTQSNTIDAEAITDDSRWTGTYINPSATNGRLYTKKFNVVWDYIKGKISSVLGLTATAYGGKASTAGTADKTKNDITMTIPDVRESGQYVIPLGNILEPTSTEINSPYNWDITGFFSIIRGSGHNGSHIKFEAGHGYSHDWRTYAYLDSENFRGVSTSMKAFQYNGKWWMGLYISTSNQYYGGKMTITYSRGLPATPTCILYNSKSNGVANEEIYNSIQDIPSSWWGPRTIHNPTTFIKDITAPNITSLEKSVAGKSDTGHTHDYLPLSGGAMTGDIQYKGSKNTYTMIKFIDNPHDTFGNGIAIGGGGLTIIGGGESSANVAAQQARGGDEKMIIANDAAIDFYTNTQSGFSSAKHITMNTDGTITADGFNGKASTAGTADKATQDANGNVITDTYATKTALSSGLSGKSDTGHTHTKSQITDFPTSLPANGGTADKATKDGNGNNIANTYMPKSGGKFTGLVTGTEFHAGWFYPKNNIDSGYGFEENENGETYLRLISNNAMTIDSPKGLNIHSDANHSGIIRTCEGSIDGAIVSIGQADGLVTIGDTSNENNGYTTINNDCKMLHGLNVNGGISVKGIATVNGSDIITKNKFSFDETTATLTITM